MIDEIANPRPVLVGETYEGTVVKTTTFGAFVNLVPGRDGLVHISKLGQRQAPAERRGGGQGGRQAHRAGRGHRRAGQDQPEAGRPRVGGAGGHRPERWRRRASPREDRGGRGGGERGGRGRAQRRSAAAVAAAATSRAGAGSATSPAASDRRAARRVTPTPHDDPSHRVHVGSPRRHRADARRALGVAGRLGAGRLPRRGAGDQRLQPLPGAPAVQGDEDPERAGHRARRSTPSAGTSTRSRRRSTRATTRACSTATWRWRSTTSRTCCSTR